MKKILVLCLAAAMILTSFTACGNNAGSAEGSGQVQEESVKEPALADVAQAVRDAYGDNYMPDMPMEAEMLSSIYSVNMDDVEDFVAESPMISTHVDTFIAIKAKEGKGESIEKTLAEYRDYVMNNALNYPMNIAKVQATQVVRHGDYVFYVLLGAYDENENASEEEAAKFAKDQVQIGLDTIASFF